MKTIYQAVMMGIVSVIIGLILFHIFASTDKNEQIKKDDKYMFETTLFFTGVILRYLMDFSLVKKYFVNDELSNS